MYLGKVNLYFSDTGEAKHTTILHKYGFFYFGLGLFYLLKLAWNIGDLFKYALVYYFMHQEAPEHIPPPLNLISRQKISEDSFQNLYIVDLLKMLHNSQ
jgi:hypothetical protein